MTDAHDRIGDYVARLGQHLAGTPAERSAVRAEVAEHLQGAADAGELDDALGRLGDPVEAAAVFSRARTAAPASFRDRFVAATVDNLPLLLVTVGIAVYAVLDLVDAGEGTVAVLFPPLVTVEVGGACVAPLPFACELGLGASDTFVRSIALPFALAWSVLGLAALEARYGFTPGKRRLGLRVVDDDALRIPFGSAVGRRLVFLLGPLAWLDWLPALWGQDRRITEALTGTRVVTVRQRAAERRDSA